MWAMMQKLRTFAFVRCDAARVVMFDGFVRRGAFDLCAMRAPAKPNSARRRELRGYAVQVRRWIYRLAPQHDLVMAVRSGRVTRRADLRDLLTFAHRFARAHEHPRIVRVPRLVPIAMIDDDLVAVAVIPARFLDDARRGRIHRRAVIVDDVKTRMELRIRIVAVSKARRYVAIRRPDRWDRIQEPLA